MSRPTGVVAFLFTDLVGSTELIDRLGDDAAEELRRTHFSLLRGALATTGGEEVKNLGDGLMVSFTSPLQAVSCAVDMQRAIAEHNRRRSGPGMGVRIGLHAGEPVREEGDFFGAAVVVAKRLCDKAQGGQILASELVAGLVGSRGGFRFLPLGSLSLKGLSQPVAAVSVEWHRAHAVTETLESAAPARVRTPAPRGPAMVGRDRELHVLETELDRTTSGEFRAVLLTADPGVGKTRLAGELLFRHGDAVLGLSARAHPLGGTTSFGLWAEAFESHLRALSPTEVTALCGGFVDDLGSLLRSAAAVRGASPVGEPPRARLLEGLAVLLTNLTRAAPVVVFLDDVHVADASSWDALHYLGRNLASCPVLVVAAARPAELAGQAGPNQVLLGLEQDGVLARLELRPLAHQALSELAEAVAGKAPPALVAWLEERSRGNPLFTLGLLRALQDEGADLTAPRLRRLPESLADRVTARLADLDESARATLETLAVVGRRVELGNVVALTGRPLDRVGPLLDDLVRSRLVTEEERGREVTYEIAHPLIQEAIYQSLGAARRHAVHRLVGRALLVAGRLGEAAPHFARSADVGDSEAIEALCGAVRQAEERQAYREALTILGTLVELIPSGDERWLQVLDGMMLQAEWVIDHRADVHAALAIPALRAIDSMLGSSSDPGRRATVKFRLASFLTWGAGDLEEGARAAREARELFEAAGDQQGKLLAHLEEVFARGFADNTWMSQARPVAEAAEAEGGRLAIMHTVGRGIGWGAFWSGAFDEGKTAFERGIAIAKEDGKIYFHSLCLGGIAFALAFEGRIGETLTLLDEAKTVNPDWRESLLLEYEIWVHWLAGSFDAALACAGESVAWNASGLSRRRAIPVPFAALSAIEVGRMAEAERFLAAARTSFGNRPWIIATQLCDHVQAILDWRQAAGPAALEAVESAAEDIRRLGAWPWAAFVLLDLAELGAESSEAATVRRAAAGLEEVAAQLDRDLYRALAAMGAAWAALAVNDLDRAAEAAEAAVRLVPGGYRSFSGRAHDVLGRALGRSNRARARESLELAVAAYESCGATWRRDQALEALRRLGGGPRPRAGAAAGPGALTRRERDVARLAALGRTAPEIARELFVSERTVESHLGRIYAKLGVESKLDLVQRAAELGLADP